MPSGLEEVHFVPYLFQNGPYNPNRRMEVNHSNQHRQHRTQIHHHYLFQILQHHLLQFFELVFCDRLRPGNCKPDINFTLLIPSRLSSNLWVKSIASGLSILNVLIASSIKVVEIWKYYLPKVSVDKHESN